MSDAPVPPTVEIRPPSTAGDVFSFIERHADIFIAVIVILLVVGITRAYRSQKAQSGAGQPAQAPTLAQDFEAFQQATETELHTIEDTLGLPHPTTATVAAVIQ